MVEAIWNPERRAKAEALKNERHEQHEAEQAARWHPYKSYREKLKAEAAERRRLKALEPKKKSTPPRPQSRSDDFRARVTQSNVISWSDPQLRKEQSERMKAAWGRPEYRDAVTKNRRGVKNPNAAAAAKKRWADPAFREKMRQAHDDPSFKQRRSEATRRGWETLRATKKSEK